MGNAKTHIRGETPRHQREVGIGCFDKIAAALNPNSATLALVGLTEAEQF